MIQTRLQPRFKYWTFGYSVLCLVLGIWGGYDYWVGIPAREAAYLQYTEAVLLRDALDAKSQRGLLTDGEIAAYEAAKQQINATPEPPQPVPGWDRALQLWAYVVGCGILGFPWCTWTLVQASKRRWTLNDDGSLAAPEGQFAANELADIDMSRWMAKSIVTVKTVAGQELRLDDYKYKGVDKIAAALAARFHPGKWTDEPRPVATDDDESEATDDAESSEGLPEQR